MGEANFYYFTCLKQTNDISYEAFEEWLFCPLCETDIAKLVLQKSS